MDNKLKMFCGSEIIKYDTGYYTEVKVRGVWVVIDSNGGIEFLAECPKFTVGDLYTIMNYSDELSSIIYHMGDNTNE